MSLQFATVQPDAQQSSPPQAVAEPSPLEYAPTLCRQAHSAWSVVGFALGLLCLVPAGSIWWEIYNFRSQLGPNSSGSMTIMPDSTGYFIDLVPVVLCVIGALRGRKVLAILGVVASLVSILGMYAAAAGSPW